MSKQLVIAGAGMAGLMAGIALRRFNPVIREKQASLPHNHAALLRFRTDGVSKLTGIPFQKVSVSKGVVWHDEVKTEATLAMNNAYSQKVVGRIVERSILNLNGGERYIAPPDFISRMAEGLNIEYNYEIGAKILERNASSDPLISTVPMPSVMTLIGTDNRPEFRWRKVWTVAATLDDCNVYQTLYYPERQFRWYRASITGAVLTIEYMQEPTTAESDAEIVLGNFGVDRQPKVTVKSQEYGKLTPLDDPDVAKRFILMLTDRYRIYSLGRFSTWRQILLDSLVRDLQLIEGLIDSRDRYAAAIRGAL